MVRISFATPFLSIDSLILLILFMSVYSQGGEKATLMLDSHR